MPPSFSDVRISIVAGVAGMVVLMGTASVISIIIIVFMVADYYYICILYVQPASLLLLYCY